MKWADLSEKATLHCAFSMRNGVKYSTKSNLYFIEQGTDKNDVQSNIMNDVRSLYKSQSTNSMNIVKIYEQLMKLNPLRYNRKGITQDNLEDTCLNYKRLQVLFIDDDRNIIFL